MKKESINFCVKLFIRIANFFRKVKIIDGEIYHYSMEKFSEEVNKMPYKSDPLGGLLDQVADPETFFDEKEYGRDCDDWARQWSIWGVHNGYKVKEYIVWNPSSLIKVFRTLHVITIIEKDDKYHLMNYIPYGPFSGEHKALEYMKKFTSYVEDLDYVFSREIKKQ